MLMMFAKREEAVGNVKLGWYGGAPGDVHTAGEATFFRRPNWTLLGEQQAHGHGLHLSPLRFPHLSMSIAEADDRGEAYVLLCRIVQGVPVVIVQGVPVVIHAGADCLDHGNFLGAVDYLSNPSWYVIWNQNTNICIIPLCLVSFIKHPMIWDLGPTPIPVMVNMQKLYQEFRRFLPSSKMQALDMYFNVNMADDFLIRVPCMEIYNEDINDFFMVDS